MVVGQFDLDSGAAPQTDSLQSNVRFSLCVTNGQRMGHCCSSPGGCDDGDDDGVVSFAVPHHQRGMMRMPGNQVSLCLRSNQTAAYSSDCTSAHTGVDPCPGPPSAATANGPDLGTCLDGSRRLPPPDADQCLRSSQTVCFPRQSCRSRLFAVPGAVAPVPPTDATDTRACARAAAAFSGPAPVSAGTSPWRTFCGASLTTPSFRSCPSSAGGGVSDDGGFSYWTVRSFEHRVGCGGDGALLKRRMTFSFGDGCKKEQAEDFFLYYSQIPFPFVFVLSGRSHSLRSLRSPLITWWTRCRRRKSIKRNKGSLITV